MRRPVAALLLLAASLADSARSQAQRAPSGPPSSRAVTAVARRFLSPSTAAMHCQSIGVHEGEQRYQCEVLDCSGGCTPRYRGVVLGFRGARVRLISRSDRRGTDGAQCRCYDPI